MSEQNASQQPAQPQQSEQTQQSERSAPTAPIVHEFVAAGPIDVNIQNLRGDIALRAEEGTAVRVELRPTGQAGREIADRMRVRFEQERLTVDAPAEEAQHLGDLVMGLGRGSGSWGDRISRGLRTAVRSVGGLTGELDLVVVVPARSRVVVHDGSGAIAVAGALARIEARAGAGDVVLERGAEEESRLATGAGDIVVAPVDGSAAVTTGTGDVVLAPVGGRIAVTTGTGDVDLAELGGEAAITTGVGDIQVRRARSGHLHARSGLGSVTVRVLPGTAARVDLATGLGDRDVRLTPADGAGEAERTLVIEGRTAKGDLRVLRAEPEPAS
jgi:hypothetical protein